MASISYPLTALTFDTVTTGAYTDVAADMTLVLGTSAGADDLGRTRVQNVATSTTIPLGRISQGYEDGQLTVSDNAYITVWDDWRVWAKIPYIDPDTRIQYKDADVEVGDYTGTDIPPVANCGPAFAATINSITGLITVLFDGSNSFAVADGASISSYAWDIADGTATIGTITSASLTVTFPAGFRWVALTVTDSNGNPHTARCPVLAVNPAADVTFSDFDAQMQITPTGQMATFNIVESVPRTTYPDGTLVLFVIDEPSASTDRSHVAFCGWEQSDDNEVRATRTGSVPGLVLHAVDVAGRLAALPGFPQEIESKATPANWTDMIAPTMDKYIHYLLLWHSTALSLADYFASGTGDDYPFVVFHSDGESLFDQVNDQAKRLLPDYLLTCNLRGQLAVTPDPMLRDAADRTIFTQTLFLEQHIASIEYEYTRPPKTHWVRGHAMLTQSDYTDVDGVDTLLTAHCIAPGTSPGQGVNEVTTREGLVPSQGILNSVTGHRFARLNNRYGSMTITPADDTGNDGLDPAAMEWFEITIGASNAGQRGFTFALRRALCQEISRRYEARRTGMVVSAQYTLELETEGVAATTVIPTGTTAVIPDPIPPPDMGLVTGQEMVAGIGKFKVYRTSDFQTASGSGGPTWDAVDLTGADEILTWVVDPFSPGYIEGSGSIDGYLASATKLYRVENLFGTPSVTTMVTFANTASWRTIQASFGTYFFEGLNPWLVCISYYGSTGGHTGTWATYSLDGGATWAAEVQVSAFYDSGGAVNPIGLYTSPKTPGLAYTAAHIATATPGVTHGFVSTDWGATWTEMTATEDPVEILPAFGYWPDETDVGYDYLGAAPSSSLTSTATSTGPVAGEYEYLVIHPPADCVRMAVTVAWSNTSTSTGGIGSQGSGLDLYNGTGVSRTGSSNYTQATINGGALTGSFDLEFTFPTGVSDWPQNRELVSVTPPATKGSSTRFRLRPGADAFPGQTRTVTETITVTITEIELDDGTIYTPSTPGILLPIHGSAGQIHLPWEDNDAEDLFYYGSLSRSANRLFDLKKAASGVLSSISPNDGTRDYGPNAGAFSIRAYDSDRQFLLLAGTGNETTASSANDRQAVYKSSNAGSSWTNIVTPATSTEVYQAAFGGDDHNIVFVWGPPSYIKYSSNFGTSLDDRSGNLTALSATHLIGICGGPT